MAIPKILVVEDEVIVAKTIANQLHQLGYVVVDMASSGAAAIAKVDTTPPDLILMDIVLKGEMDGITAATQIRQNRDIPIIYLTAYADDQTLERAKLTHPFGYIIKPFTANDLRVAVELGLFKHQVAQELQEQRNQFATLLQSMGDAVIATDAEGLVTFMNPVAEALTGWHQEEAVGKAVTEVLQLMDEISELPVDNPVDQVLEEQRIVHLNEFTTLITREGTSVPIGDSASPLRRANGDISGVVLVFWDMSDRRQAELLTQALAKEKEVNRLKSQFVSIVSHEFRNPLAVILMATELLGQGQILANDKKESYLQRIRTAVQSMNQLMEDVLVIGQADADRLVCHPTSINLETFCRDLVEEFSMVEGSSHTLNFIFQGDSTEAVMDEKILRYVLANILSNAIKYSPSGTVIQFSLLTDSTANQAIFQVQDQGIGIPEVEQSQLFDSFFRASNVRSIQGTGLGLAIVKRCVDAHQGQIRISSQVGLGTTVHITFPFKL